MSTSVEISAADPEMLQYSVSVGLHIVGEQLRNLQTTAALLRGRRRGIGAKDCEGLAIQLDRANAELETAQGELRFVDAHLYPPKKPEQKPLRLVSPDKGA